jgi:hypothetical protein
MGKKLGGHGVAARLQGTRWRYGDQGELAAMEDPCAHTRTERRNGGGKNGGRRCRDAERREHRASHGREGSSQGKSPWLLALLPARGCCAWDKEQGGGWRYAGAMDAREELQRRGRRSRGASLLLAMEGSTVERAARWWLLLP